MTTQCLLIDRMFRAIVPTNLRARCAAVLLGTLAASAAVAQAQTPSREQVLDAMKRATTFMTEKIAYRGGYVWAYLPDKSRRWGELEARDTMIWVQPPGTASMGHLFLDAYHVTGDELYYRAAARAAEALTEGQHPSGGWNYLVDFAGEESLREWYDTVGRNAWRLEEFQHDHGNATFDDAGTAESAKLLLRLYAGKKDPKLKTALDRAIGFVLNSQQPSGAWPQRYPHGKAVSLHGLPDYTGYPTFNDDVAAENIDFLIQCYQVLDNPACLEAARRGMKAFLVTQQPSPQAGWALQYTPDLKPAGARTYEPKALTTHTTARSVELLMHFYRLTGDRAFLARIPEALAWLESVQLPPGVAPPGRTHPTFVGLGTNKPLYVHRRGSNVVNGQYYVDDNPRGTIAHYSSFRAVDVAALRRQYQEVSALPPAEATKGSPLAPGAEKRPLPRLVAVTPGGKGSPATVIAALTADGAWIAPLGTNSHPYRTPSSKTLPAGDFSQTHVGDESDTSPFPDATVQGISTTTYIQNMSVLIRALDERK